jgi:diguanylate cyclase (GGDEF)-like protein
VARCLREQSRGTTDHVARIGGEEFAVLLPGLQLDRCGDIAERLRVGVAVADLPHLGAPPPRRITISCGAASFQAGQGFTQADLFAAADAALYAAKQAGRNRVCVADQPPQPVRPGTPPAAPATSPRQVESG